MSRLRSFSGLKWVGSELEEVIRKARDALEEYVEGGGETAVLGPCVEQLNQVRGVLEMLELRGAGWLAEEMQVAAGALKEGRVASPEEAAEALMLAMIQLPDYLEKLAAGGEDIPLLLLPAINDLRASRGVQPLSETDLVVSGGVPAAERKAADEEQIRNLRRAAHGARLQLHKGMLGWFRGAAPEEGLRSLGSVFAELEQKATADPVLRGVFRTAHAVTEGLLDGSIESSKEVKGLVGRVDRVIKQLAAKGIPEAHKVVGQGVLKELLQLVSSSDSQHPTIQAVKVEYDFARAFPSEDELAEARRRMLAPNADALAGMRAAAIKELLPLKDTLDLYMRSGREQSEQLLGLEEPMRRLANTLDMVSLSDLSKRLRDRAGDIKTIGSGEVTVDDALLMGIAGDLLYVESSLENIQREARGGAESAEVAATQVPQGEMQGLVNKTLEEAAVEMAKAKEAIIVYITSPADIRPLETTPDIFHGVAGALRVISRNEAAEVLDQIRDFIQNVLITRSLTPEQRMLDSLAEAITGIEYYMEAVGEGRRDTGDILNIARSALGRLEHAPKVETEIPLPEPEEAVPAMEEVVEIPAPASEVMEERVTEEPIVVAQPQAADEIDPEILEIFLEEAREEEPVVRECYGRWRENPGDAEALTTLRRSFHTLKGSGRMVGAVTVGDFAWSVENLLNHVIDQTVEPSSEIKALMDKAVAALPELINAQEEGRPAQVDTATLMATADALAGKKATPPEVSAAAALETVAEYAEPAEEPSSFIVDDSELSEIFEAEAREHLATLYAFISGCGQQPLPCGFHDELVRSLHTLAGSARMIGIGPLAVVAKALEVKASLSLDEGLGADAEFLGYLKEGTDTIKIMVDALGDPSIEPPDTDELVARIEGYVPGQAPVVPASEEEAAAPGEEVEGLPVAAEAREEEELSLELAESSFIIDVPEKEEISEEGEEETISLEELEELLPAAEAPEEEEITLEGLEEVVPEAEVSEEEIALEGLEEAVPEVEALEEEEIALEGLEEAVPEAEPLEEEEIAQEALEEAVPEAEVPEEKIALEGLEEAVPEVEALEEGEITLEGLEEVVPEVEALEEGEITLEGLEEVVPEVETLEEEEIALEGLEETVPIVEALEEEEVALTEPEEAEEEISTVAAAPEEMVEAVPEGVEELPSRFEEVVADPELVEIFVEEAQELLASLDTDLREWEMVPDDVELPNRMQRTLHTLKGGARLAGVQSVGDLGHAMEELVVALGSGGLGSASGDRFALAQRAADLLSVQLNAVELGQPVPLATGLIEDLQSAALPSAEAEAEIEIEVEEQEPVGVPTATPPAPAARDEETEEVTGDRELLEIFLEEAQELLDQLDNGLRQWDENPDDQEAPDQLKRNLHTLKGGARMAGVQSIGNLSHALETLLSGLTPQVVRSEPTLMPLAQKTLDQLAEQIDDVRQGQPVYRASHLVAELEQVHRGVSEAAEAGEPEISAEEAVAPPPPAPPEEEMEEVAGDHELLEIFLEEAQELLDQLDNGLRQWDENPDDHEAPDQLKRYLHTLKGGARMAGVQSIGNLSHALETLISGVTADTIKSQPTLMALAQRALDRLSEQIERVGRGQPVPLAAELLEELELVHGRVTGAVPEATAAKAVETTAEPGREEKETVVSLRKVVTPEAVPPVAPQPVQEQVRVRSDLLNRLVNNSGEISIYRARLEQQNTTLGFNLGELEQTVTRLHNQLRQMEIETEAQILYRYEQEHEEGTLLGEEELDPLELDRFSTIQQLSRSLMETVNDLASIKNLLSEQQKETETLLLQQSRISNDLQDGLLRTRMVPFTQLDPRLRRVVRQTANSVGKHAELEVIGGEGEMDRSILDRMLAPLEHILRNAVSHGIEDPERRKAAGKSETGKISIYLTREGNDVIITVSDDGAGLNLEAIRRRAVEKGLLEKGARIDDDDLMQLVLEPGFSTVKEVTQISGRGVGTDVVVSEVKQLGGSLEIDSQPGHGTSFSIRLPFTLAITESLLVEIGDDIFAVPHPTMEGVVRISSDDLARSYDGSAPYFSYAGHDYHVRYLGALLGTSSVAVPEGRKWLPLLLVRAGEHRVAIQVDHILGNRQVVVKSVGPQLSSVRWISGGTILPDGRVALILDVSALVRMDVVQAMQGEAVTPAGEERPTRVMVVDDSITVRKVTTRLLKRHNMEVTTAKDGVDAVALLQEEHPDVMLLDIEMPRMDGYELARHMRSSAELEDIPIIMITSRSGEKHRNIALSLGVKRYLGKPYQETELLDTIYSVLAEVEAEAEA